MNFTNMRISASLIFSFGLLSIFIIGLTVLAAFHMTGPDSGAIKYVLTLGLVALVTSIALSWWIGRSISSPLDEVNLVARRMASGDLSEPYEASAPGGI